MIRIGIVDLSGQVDAADRGKRQSAQSKFARLLLKEIYKLSYGEEPPRINIAEGGKPYFEGGEPFFSITHEGELAAVALCDGGEVGIDIQSLPKKLKSRDKIAEKLTRTIRESDYYFTRGGICEPTEVEFYFFAPIFSEDGECRITPCEGSVYSSPCRLEKEDGQFLSEWTELEALLKLSGGGFAHIGRVTELLADAKIISRWTVDASGAEYSLTVAVKNEK